MFRHIVHFVEKEARMTPLEPNPSSIRHGVVFAEFREFGLSSVKTQDGRQKIANRLCDSTFYGNLMNTSVNLIGILVVKSYCIFAKICKNRNSFCYRLNAIKFALYLRKVTGSVTYTVKTGTL